MNWAPGSEFVSPDGLVSFDRNGQRLDEYGHGTGTYQNPNDLIPMAWIRPPQIDEEEKRKQLEQAANLGGYGQGNNWQAQTDWSVPATYAPSVPEGDLPPGWRPWSAPTPYMSYGVTTR